jgi:excisionase family DNA binding protein
MERVEQEFISSVPQSKVLFPTTPEADSHSLFHSWLTAQEAASYLRISPRTLLSWVREGHLKGYPLHGVKRRVWRFRVQDLDAAMGFTAPTSLEVLTSLPSSGVLQ